MPHVGSLVQTARTTFFTKCLGGRRGRPATLTRTPMPEMLLNYGMRHIKRKCMQSSLALQPHSPEQRKWVSFVVTFIVFLYVNLTGKVRLCFSVHTRGTS